MLCYAILLICIKYKSMVVAFLLVSCIACCYSNSQSVIRPADLRRLLSADMASHTTVSASRQCGGAAPSCRPRLATRVWAQR